MKNKIICLFLFFSQLIGAQQYTFYQLEDVYQNIENPNVLMTDSSWSDTLLMLDLDFDFTFYSKHFNQLLVDVNGTIIFGLYDSLNNISDTIFIIHAFDIESKLGKCTIPGKKTALNYKKEGNQGNRSIIIEWLNAGIVYDALEQYINFQVCISENDDIKIHYGDNTYTTPLYEDNFNPIVGVATYYKPSGDTIINNLLFGTLINCKSELPGFYNAVYNPKLHYETIKIKGWPDSSTVFKFSYKEDVILFDPLTEGDRMTGAIYKFGEYPIPMGTLVGAHIGHNNYRDYEWAQKFILNAPALIKGVVCQNYGSAQSSDSISFTVYQIDTSGLPGQKVVQRKIPVTLLKLDATLNYISFNSPIALQDSFIAAFGVTPYENLTLDTIGLYFCFLPIEHLHSYNLENRTLVRAFNDCWYDMHANHYISSRSTIHTGLDVTMMEDINLALAPIVNFDLDNTTPISDSLKSTPTLIKDDQEGIIPFCSIYPNPADLYTTISFTLDNTSHVNIYLYDSRGKLRKKFLWSTLGPDSHTRYINLAGLESGIYYFILKTNKNINTSVIIVK